MNDTELWVWDYQPETLEQKTMRLTQLALQKRKETVKYKRGIRAIVKKLFK